MGSVWLGLVAQARVQRRRHLGNLGDVGRDVECRGEESVDHPQREDLVSDAAQRRPHDAVAEADGKDEQPRDRLADGRNRDADDDGGDVARAATVEADVVKVPGGGLEQPEKHHARDAHLQWQQLIPVAPALQAPRDAKEQVGERHHAKEGQEEVELAWEVAVGVEPRRVPREEDVARVELATRQHHVVHAAPVDRHVR